MSNAANEIREAIDTSRRENRIVRLGFTRDRETELLCAADDSADDDGEAAFWGEDWRVHLTGLR